MASWKKWCSAVHWGGVCVSVWVVRFYIMVHWGGCVWVVSVGCQVLCYGVLF